MNDPVAARACAIAVAKLAATLVSDTAIASERGAGGARVYHDAARFSLDAIRRELVQLERELG